MCGISFSYTETASVTRMQASLGKLDHRGPDDSRYEQRGKVCLGHVRLSIVDIDHSIQPMSDGTGKHWIIFNGEIYNYKALRDELSEKWQFRTRGDTEVLLAGLVLYGASFIARLDGMWAFAYWSEAETRLLLSRDPLGKKPLYFVDCNDEFYCASELPALNCLIGLDWKVDNDSLADYLRYGFCMPGYTFWQGVYELEPGHYAIWQPGKSVRKFQYWRLPDRDYLSLDDGNEKIIDTFEKAVRKRLIADVEVGAFLSGGFDSTLVCKIAQEISGTPLRAFTIAFDDSSFDESNFAKLAAKHLGCNHILEKVCIGDHELLENLLFNSIGQPFFDPSLLPTSLVSSLASRNVKVVLSGDGADEFFGGYQRYQARVILDWYLRLPRWLQNNIEKVISALPSTTQHHSASLIKKASLFVKEAGAARNSKSYIAPEIFTHKEFNMLFPDLVGKGHSVRITKNNTRLDELSQMLKQDSLVYLPQDILQKVDRASMAHGLEVRSPFLDVALVELSMLFDPRKHLSLGRGKRLIKKAFSEQIPQEIRSRKKQGFALPLGAWFKGELGLELERKVDFTKDIVQPESVKLILNQHRAGIDDYGLRLWAIFVLTKFMSRTRG